MPIKHFRSNRKRKLLTTELFGPFQIVTEYNNAQLETVLEICESVPHHLTAAIVSNDPIFTDKVIGETVNGTTY